jgi:hypothetical protein
LRRKKTGEVVFCFSKASRAPLPRETFFRVADELAEPGEKTASARDASKFTQQDRFVDRKLPHKYRDTI